MTAADALYPASFSDDYGTARHLLQQYEGWRATARTIGGLGLVAPIAAIPPGLLALSVGEPSRDPGQDHQRDGRPRTAGGSC
jgi:hypothetical protein